ncbi:MAG: NAD-dependent epimerase/dehydratase [Flavobacteriales bacterium]|nr:NAD-dependent epimerase/dehydratase [Flavobacteriales bacterium]|tara:strand:+ start:22456 stop:23421 length:966 start_codon:yes stop_codon:yes gene_type:complete
MKDFILFGGSGFVGTHLSKILQKQAKSFVVTDIVEPILQDVFFINCDVRDKISSDIESDSETIIINLAAVHKTPGHPDQHYFETNIKGAENVCNFAREKKINTIVFTSSIAVYGTYEDKKSESTLPMPDIPYGISKLSAEYIHKRWQAEDPLKRRLIILRPGVVFGMYEKANFTRLINSLSNNFFAYVGRKDTKKACIYVKDLSKAIYDLSLDKSLNCETYNVSYNPSLPINKIVAIASEIGNMKFPRLLLPKSIILFLSSFLYFFLKKKDFNPKRMTKLVVSNDIDSEKIMNKVTFKFGFRKGIKDWMEETHFLVRRKIF